MRMHLKGTLAFVGVILSLSFSLWAHDEEFEPDLPDMLFSEDIDSASDDFNEDTDILTDRVKREARGVGGGRGGGRSSSGGYKSGGYKSHSSGSNHRTVNRVRQYIKSAGKQIKVKSVGKGYSLTTSKKTSLRITPVPSFIRNNHHRAKITSTVLFKKDPSNFLMFSLRSLRLLAQQLFHLLFVNDPDSSNIYVGYYEDDEDDLVNTYTLKPTIAPTLPLTSIRKKNFKPVLMLNADESYTVEVVWKPDEAMTSFSMPKTTSVSYTTTDTTADVTTDTTAYATTDTTTASEISTGPTVYSFSGSSTTQGQNTNEAIPTEMPDLAASQILIKDKDKRVVAVLNLSLKPKHISYDNEGGHLLKYEIDGSNINLLTTIQKEDDDRSVGYWSIDWSRLNRAAGMGTSSLMLMAPMLTAYMFSR